MPEMFEVTSVTRTPDKDWTSQYGPLHVWVLGLRNPMKAAEAAECNRKPNSPLIQVGEQIEGDLTADDRGTRFKVANGWRPEGAPHQLNAAASLGSPAASSGQSGRDDVQDFIIRQHSQDVALRFLEIAVKIGVKTADSFTFEGVAELAARFHEDVKASPNQQSDGDLPF